MQAQTRNIIIALVALVVIVVAIRACQRTKHSEVVPQEPTQTINMPTEIQKEMPVTTEQKETPAAPEEVKQP